MPRLVLAVILLALALVDVGPGCHADPPDPGAGESPPEAE